MSIQVRIAWCGFPFAALTRREDISAAPSSGQRRRAGTIIPRWLNCKGLLRAARIFSSLINHTFLNRDQDRPTDPVLLKPSLQAIVSM